MTRVYSSSPWLIMWYAITSGSGYFRKNFRHRFVFGPIRSRPNSRTGGGIIKRVGRDVVEDLLRGKKNPVQCLNEYASMTKKKIVFTEAGHQYLYASSATIDGVLLPQGTGKSKKEAKIAGARAAFAALLDLDEEAFDTRFAGISDIKIDRNGNRTIESGPNDAEHIFTDEFIQELTQKLNDLAVHPDLLRSKGVEQTIRRSVMGERSLSVTLPLSMTPNYYGDELIHNRSFNLSSSSFCQRQTTSTPLTIHAVKPIENPITHLRDYCKKNMIGCTIKSAETENPENPNQYVYPV
ncbi:unnamed protein product [Didymodactylos carnosus]|uniref:DRBM domain-containing protein n=1 Tax=Didymodactylos carnosus TaxID=1234261 RepID=A0A814I839_9BILA|nr:unnamed protein product [Didymodactylos carnosus]CAF1020873.1 unnamed protein product [Didymodactylos carnosus]CAF3738760.1 unnamed protein product [Didymodactylos carnosus]CAF3792273.1 unnamed protein product [Didymodactylos carnosus]